MVRINDGTVLVDRDECDRWADDFELRENARAIGLEAGRLFAVTTTGGYVVDVWQVDHWQSGLNHDDGAVGWSPDMYTPH